MMGIRLLIMVGIVAAHQLKVLEHHRPISYDLKAIVTHVPIADSIIDHEQVEYCITLEIGSNQQQFNVMIDTGSSDLWLPAKGAKGFHHLKSDQFYDCSSSSTCSKTDEHIRVDYDDGPIKGTIVWDQVAFDGHILPKQSFLLVEEAWDNMRNSPGLLGLSFQHISSNPNPTVISTMVQDGLIPSRLFSLYLTDHGKVGSKIIFGGVDPTYQQVPNSPFLYAKLSQNDVYQINIDGVKLGNKSFEIQVGLVDSGTSCLTMPKAIIEPLIEEFKSTYGISCTFHKEHYSPEYSLTSCYSDQVTSEGIINEFPVVQIVIDAANILELTPADYIYHCKIVKYESYKTVCLTKLELSHIDDQLILGDAFLQSFYTIFDQDNLQLNLITSRKLGFSHSINNGVLKIKQEDRLFQVQTLSASTFGFMCLLVLIIL